LSSASAVTSSLNVTGFSSKRLSANNSRRRGSNNSLRHIQSGDGINSSHCTIAGVARLADQLRIEATLEILGHWCRAQLVLRQRRAARAVEAFQSTSACGSSGTCGVDQVHWKNSEAHL